MGRKSNNLFAILVIPLSVKRDNIISSVLDDKKVEYTNMKYVGGGGQYGIFYSGNFSYIKTWKTENGAKNYLKNIVQRSVQYIKNDPFLYGETYSEDDWKNVEYEVIHIEKEWNQYIDSQIKETTHKYNQSIIKV